jgi:hypothetical protein
MLTMVSLNHLFLLLVMVTCKQDTRTNLRNVLGLGLQCFCYLQLNHSDFAFEINASLTSRLCSAVLYPSFCNCLHSQGM